MRIQVKDFMSTPVFTTTDEKRVSEVSSFMERKGIHALPVISYTKQLPDAKVIIIGIVTTTDLSKEVNGDVPVKDIMTKKVHIIHMDSSVQAAAKMMLKHKVHHLVVMNDGQVAGMISSIDFVKLLAKHPLA